MYILSVHWDVVMLWAILSLTGKLYIVCLLASVVYTIYSLSRIVVLSRSMKNTSFDAEPAGLGLIVMARTIENVRQLHLLLLLLFGVTLANEVFATLRAIRESAVSLSALGIDVFGPCVVFAFGVSGVLAILQVLQWIVSARLRRSV
jgi:hypothetical protein